MRDRLDKILISSFGSCSCDTQKIWEESDHYFPTNKTLRKKKRKKKFRPSKPFHHFPCYRVTSITFSDFEGLRDMWLTNWTKWYSIANSAGIDHIFEWAMSSSYPLPATAYTQTSIPLHQTPSRSSRGSFPSSGMYTSLILWTNLQFVWTDLNTLLQNTLLDTLPLTIQLSPNLRHPLDALEYLETHLFFPKPLGNESKCQSVPSRH